MNRTMKLCLTVAALLAAFAVTGWMEETDVTLQQVQYCRMVHEYKMSDGAVGWPDYAKSYDASCNEDGTIKKGS